MRVLAIAFLASSWNRQGNISMKRFVIAALVIFGLAIPNLAKASVVYTLSGSGDFQFFLSGSPGDPVVENFSFVFTTPTFITSNMANVAIPGCAISGGQFGCTGASFDIYPTFTPTVPGIPAGGDIISLQFTTPTGEAGGALVFDAGAFGALGVYTTLAVIEHFPGQFAGSFANATLTITQSEVPLPAALPLFASILAGGGLIAWRRKRKAEQLAA